MTVGESVTPAGVPAGCGDRTDTLQHDAFLYTDASSYRTGLLDFVRCGIERAEPVLAVVPPPGLDLLHSALDDAELAEVRTLDMSVAGRNPGRIIGSVITPFIREHEGRQVRIIGEPVWPDRTAEEYPACAEHEALINVALHNAPAHVLCPYDVTRLDRAILVDATRTHPLMTAGPNRWTSPGYTDPRALAALFDLPLSAPPSDADVLVITRATGTSAARRFVHDFADCAGMAPARIADLRLAVQELVVNTLLHSGGSGLLTIWVTEHQLVCQVQDGGRIEDPLVGRRPPAPPEIGHGLFIVHEVCDLVRIHRRSGGTTVRIHLDLR